jgi:hypothetical protein
MRMEFTQFMFPDGRRKPNSIKMPEDVEALAHDLEGAGWRFEIECFPDSQVVHADCCDAEEPLASGVCPNGEQVPIMIEAMVREAHGLWVKADRKKAVGKAVALDRDW